MRVGEIVESTEPGSLKPLAGVRVLAVEQMQALPFATQLLAHLGAEVVKVEHPVHGESGRGSRPTVRDTDGNEVGATYLRNNLSKRSITIDLKADAGRELFVRLVPRFDVVAENYKPGAMQRMGLGYEALARVHPALVYLSISGFGNLVESPYGDWPAYAPIVEAMAGLYEANRRAVHDRPRIGVAGSLGDIGSSLFGAIGTLAALRQRDRTGEGQHVDIAMFDAMVAIADMIPFMWSMGVRGNVLERKRGATGIVDSFAARDGYFIVEVVREHQFERLARAIGQPGWISDPGLATRDLWAEKLESLIRPTIEHWAADKTKLEAARALCAHGVAAGPSNGPEDVIADAHVARHNMLIEVARPDGGDDLLVVGNPIKMSKMAEGPIARWPVLGGDTDLVLGTELGLSYEEISERRRRHVV